MRIELKKVHFSEQLSDETNAFTAEVYVDGKKCGLAKNDGQGGETYIYCNVGCNDLLSKAEAYAKTLPPIKYGSMELPMNLVFHVDLLFEDWLKAKYQKKFQAKLKRDMLFNICVGTETKYNMTGFTMRNPMGRKSKASIEQVLFHSKGEEMIKATIVRELANFPDGKLLNTNIPSHLLPK